MQSQSLYYRECFGIQLKKKSPILIPSALYFKGMGFTNFLFDDNLTFSLETFFFHCLIPKQGVPGIFKISLIFKLSQKFICPLRSRPRSKKNNYHSRRPIINSFVFPASQRTQHNLCGALAKKKKKHTCFVISHKTAFHKTVLNNNNKKK